MFEKAVLRLTLWYIAILILLSVIFSVSFYTFSSDVLNTLQEHQTTILKHTPFLSGPPQALRAFNQDRITQIQQAQGNIEDNLLYFNLIILLIGGGLSYLLARRTLRPIQEASEAQRDFTSNASHELRTPLTAMKSEIEVSLRDPDLTLATSKKLHKSTLEEIDKLEELASGLLRLARQDTIRARDFSVLPVREIMTEAIAHTQNTAKKKQIKIEQVVGDQTIYGERWSLIDLISIILDNAIKYSPEKTTVTIVVDTPPHHNQVSVAITDHGTGISAPDLPHIFDRFYRAEHSHNKETAPGYGLGLALAKKIAQLHHGHIDVTTKPGSGCTFTIILPASARHTKKS